MFKNWQESQNKKQKDYSLIEIFNLMSTLKREILKHESMKV